MTACTPVSPGYEATGQLTSAAISQTICGTGKYSAGSVAACLSVSAGNHNNYYSLWVREMDISLTFNDNFLILINS